VFRCGSKTGKPRRGLTLSAKTKRAERIRLI
jgi:hypothetical protein